MRSLRGTRPGAGAREQGGAGSRQPDSSLLSPHPSSRHLRGLVCVTPQRESMISMGVANAPITLQTKLILMALISLNGPITIIVYAPFVRASRKYVERSKPVGK